MDKAYYKRSHQLASSRWRIAVSSWAVAVCVVLAGCTTAPALRHPEGSGKQVIPGNQAAAAHYEAQRNGVPLPADPVVLSHDAADIQAIGAQIEQLKQQINIAKGLAPADPTPGKITLEAAPRGSTNYQPASKELPLLVSAGKRFEVNSKDTTVLGVIARWADLGDWRVQLNGAPLKPALFPSHSVTYADIPLAQGTNGVGDDEIDAAIGALLQAHQHFKGRLSLTLSLKPSSQDLDVSSLMLPTSSSP